MFCLADFHHLLKLLPTHTKLCTSSHFNRNENVQYPSLYVANGSTRETDDPHLHIYPSQNLSSPCQPFTIMNLSSTSSPSPDAYASPDKKPHTIMKRIVTHDSSNEPEDAECISIVDGCLLMEDCKTPEQEGKASYNRFSARPINEPPLLKPRRSSLHQEYRSWNAPIEETSSSFCSSRNAPMFPDSPSLAQRSHVVTNAPWFTHQATEVAASTPCPTASASLPRRVLLSFQDCHIVRLPPRLSRSDGYLHDISWRLQMAASGSSSSLPNTSTSTPCRKKSRTQSDSPEPDDMPLLTPVEGYTIPNAPYATFFSQDQEEGPFHEHHEGRRHKDVLYWDSSTDSAGSSRVTTPLPLLDIDDDSEASSNEGRSSANSSEDRMDLTSTSGTVPSTTLTTARLLPVKPPKLKMRTNHPVLLQSPSFTSLQLLSPPDGNTM